MNEKLGAGIPFTNDGSGNLVKPPNRRNNFGGSLGGPITMPRVYDGHNRTFFFYSFEQFRQIETRSGLLQTMPTDRMRNGDFGEALTGRQLAVDPLGRPIMENAIYDPRTTRVVNGQVVRDPFPNNVIPRELLDPVALKIQDNIPRATRSGMINNWDQSFPADTIKSISTIKLDHNFTGNNKLSGYYSRYWGPHYNGSDGLPIPITKVRHFETSTHTLRVTYDWVLSPTTLLNSRVGYVRHWNPDFGLPEVREYDPIAGLGLVGAVDGIGFPVIGSMFTQTGGGMSEGLAVAGSLPATKKPQALVNITHSRNTHTYKAGFEWRNDIFSNPQIHGSHGAVHVQCAADGAAVDERTESRRRRRRVAVRELPARNGEQRLRVESNRSELAEARGLGVPAGHVACQRCADARLRREMGSAGLRLRRAGSPQHVLARRRESCSRRTPRRDDLRRRGAWRVQLPLRQDVSLLIRAAHRGVVSDQPEDRASRRMGTSPTRRPASARPTVVPRLARAGGTRSTSSPRHSGSRGPCCGPDWCTTATICSRSRTTRASGLLPVRWTRRRSGFIPTRARCRGSTSGASRCSARLPATSSSMSRMSATGVKGSPPTT